MTPNLLIIVATGLIPMVLGMAWYHPSLFGTAWLKEAGMTQEDMKANQKPLKFLLGFICNVLLAFGLFTMVTHEFSILGLVGGDMEAINSGTAAAFLAEYGGNYARFSHGVVHALFAAVIVAIPFIGHQCLWQGKSLKYFLIDFAFWAVCMILMGGIIAQWGANPIA
ncbi:MAG: DUF1761 domain-containing protein [Saprospiraceae bacterium]|nr:DUF1761 domain-containing protein [Saprospiraceae bacterium]